MGLTREGGCEGNAHGGQQGPSSQGDAHQVVPKGPPQVLPNLVEGGMAELDGIQYLRYLRQARPSMLGVLLDLAPCCS